MSDERGFWMGLEDRFERFGKPRAPRAFIRKMIHFLKVNQDWHTEIGGERIHATELGPVRRDVKLHLTETLRAVLHRLREQLLGLRFCYVGAVEPGEPPRRCGL